ncbi:MAG: DUF2752 domain-containing protein [Acutalibacteraceae bacterium]|nr:DUF2752 domain-containing protein [Acutalibacteraceae bacterium]
MKIKNKGFLKYIIIILVILFCYRCPIKAIFDIPCAGCGLTRAMICAMHFDFVGAFELHPLFGVIALEILYLIFRNRIRLKPQIEVVVLILTLILLTAVYYIRYFA